MRLRLGRTPGPRRPAPGWMPRSTVLHRQMPMCPIRHSRPLASDPPTEDDGGDPMTSTSTTLTRERTDLIESLRRHRNFLRFTVRDLTDEQAQQRPTASALNLAGLIKHVAGTEASWMRFAQGGAEAMRRNWGPDIYSRHWHLEREIGRAHV